MSLPIGRVLKILACASSPKVDVWADANLTQEEVAELARDAALVASLRHKINELLQVHAADEDTIRQLTEERDVWRESADHALRVDVAWLRDGLERIANHPHNTLDPHLPCQDSIDYRIGMQDGHRCAAELARSVLAATREPDNSSAPKEEP